MTEIWRPFRDTRYDISNYGRVKNRERGVFLTHTRTSVRYVQVQLRNRDGSKSNYAIHRLVCEVFHGPPAMDGMEVDHINRNPHDNRARNLRWVTRREHESYRVQVGELAKNAKLTNEEARAIFNAPRVHGSAAALARKYGVCEKTISQIVNGKRYRAATITAL